MGIFSEMDMAMGYEDMKGIFGDEPEFETAKDETEEKASEQMAAAKTDDKAEEEKKPETAEAAAAKDADEGMDEEDRKRLEHEQAEAKRKAEWEARQQAKKDAEKQALDRIASMTDEELLEESAKRVGKETERLTRRNMKDCVAMHVQEICHNDPQFAKMVMHPHKSMVNCFHYINRKAKEFIDQEMKDNDIKPERGIYGCDVPDDLCYTWAEEYFRDPNAKEDQQEEEKFIPKPYIGAKKTKAKPKKSAEKKPAAKKKDAKEKPAEAAPADTKESKKDAIEGQMTLEQLPLFEMAGTEAL